MWRALFTPPTTVIRTLTAADAGVLAELHGASFARGWDRADIEAMLTDGFVLGQGVGQGVGRSRSGAALDGFVLSRRASDEAEILTVAVARAARRRGLARRLLLDHCGKLAALGVRTLFLEVDQGNVPARALYRRLGFAEVGRRDAYYRKPDGSTATALVLGRGLP